MLYYMVKVKLNRAQKRRVIRLMKRRGPRNRRARIRKPLALHTHAFVERYPSNYLTIQSESATTTANGLFKSWNFDGIPQSSSYTEIFAMYKINKVIVEFRYKGASQSASGTTGFRQNEVNPVLYIKRDHDDDGLSTGGNKETLATLKESSKTFEIQLTNNRPSFSMAIKPSILMDDDNYIGALGTQHVPVYNKWLSCKEPSVAHFGLKAYAVANGGSSSDVMGQIEVTYKIYFQAKGNE